MENVIELPGYFAEAPKMLERCFESARGERVIGLCVIVVSRDEQGRSGTHHDICFDDALTMAGALSIVRDRVTLRAHAPFLDSLIHNGIDETPA